MKKIKFILICLFLIVWQFGSAQLVKIEQINVLASYHKTVHLIFPSDIKYFNSIDNVITIDQPEGVPFILRIKANLTKCDKNTNVSVATADGKFYNFSVQTVDDITFTNLFLDSYTWETPEVIQVNDSIQTHLIFPEIIKYIDVGDQSLVSELAEGTRNILWMKAEEGEIKMPDHGTNISVVTGDNTFYSYNVIFSADCPVVSYFTNQAVKEQKEQVVLRVNEFTDGKIIDIMNNINSFGRHIQSLGEKKDGIMFSILNVFIHENMILFRCEIENLSAIPYEIEYMKFNIIDKKKEKLTASQEIEQMPIFLENYISNVRPYDKSIFVAGFDKFTIPDDKFLQIELNEKNGGRHVLFKLKNKDIISGQTF